MCGIAGFVNLAGSSRPSVALDELVYRMTVRLEHRGPDRQGVWLDDSGTVALGHRRLSIIDTSSSGDQPMMSGTGRHVLVFNGEIYNFETLRRELLAEAEPPVFRGHSDSEVLLACHERLGARATARLNGMFAFAIWDRRDRTLYLARDRFGEKPLYYFERSGVFGFASELKALLEHPSCPRDLDEGAIAAYLRTGFVPAPSCIYAGVFKLQPGSALRVSAAGGMGSVERFWHPSEIMRDALREPFRGTYDEATDLADQLIRRTVKDRMVSDVPLGAFLSGGIDSSAIVGVMQAQSTKAVRTFTIGFNEERVSEAAHARAVASHLGTDHTEFVVTSREAMDVIPLLPSIFDEPFADSSQIPTYLLSRLARRHVTVSLSGDGGDELFGGYSRYAWALRLSQSINRIPDWMRPPLAAGAIAAGFSGSVASALGCLLPRNMHLRDPARKARQLAALLRSGQALADIYRPLISFPIEHSLMLRQQPAPTLGISDDTELSLAPLHQMMLWDATGYLPNDILTKVDRASMAVGLESRAPFLDSDLLRFAWSMPDSLLMSEGQGKWLLRQVLYRYVPQSLVERQKRGFAIPLTEWLRGDLKPWVEDMLAEQSLRDSGIWDVRAVRLLWNNHRSGKADSAFTLWSVLVLQQWMRARI